jgi:hypothetical protein
MAMAEGETVPAQGGLLVVLYLEVIIYLLVGAKFFLGADYKKPKPWQPANAFIDFQCAMDQRFHGSLAFIVGAVALQGITSGVCSRFEVELVFFSLSLMMNMCWLGLAMPLGVKGQLFLFLSRPDLWFSVYFWVNWWHLPRLPILIVCILVNIQGIYGALAVHGPKMGSNDNFEKLITEADPETKEKLAKIGVFSKPVAAREQLL